MIKTKAYKNVVDVDCLKMFIVEKAQKMFYKQVKKVSN